MATFLGAALSEVDLTTVPESQYQITNIFGDASVILPGGVTPDHPDWPPHWATKKLNDQDFEIQWRAFQATLPAGWYKS
jgi:hypothetical protein